MLTLMRIEIFKLLKRTKTIVVLVAFMLLTALIAFGIHSDDKNRMSYDSPDFQISNIEQNIKQLEFNKTDIPQDIKGDSKKVQEYVSSIDTQIQDLSSQLETLKSNKGKPVDWKKDLKDQISQLQTTIDQNKNADESMKSEWSLQLQQLQYLQKQDIKPMKDYEFNSINFAKQYIALIGQIFLVIGLAVFASDMVSGECTPPTLKLLLTQPVSRGKVLFSKFVSVNIIGAALIILVELIAFLVIGLIFGFGNLNYPMTVGAKYHLINSGMAQNGGSTLALISGSAHVIPAWQYIIEAFLLQALFIIVCISFAFLISSLMKSSMVAMGASVVITIASTVLFLAVNSLKKVGAFVFTSYGDVTSILEGSLARVLNNPSLTINLIIAVLVIWMVLCYAVSHIVFTKKDILI